MSTESDGAIYVIRSNGIFSEPMTQAEALERKSRGEIDPDDLIMPSGRPDLGQPVWQCRWLSGERNQDPVKPKVPRPEQPNEKQSWGKPYPSPPSPPKSNYSGTRSFLSVIVIVAAMLAVVALFVSGNRNEWFWFFDAFGTLLGAIILQVSLIPILDIADVLSREEKRKAATNHRLPD